MSTMSLDLSGQKQKLGKLGIGPPILYRIDPLTGCWIWLRGKNDRGYGQFYNPVKGKIQYAHIYFYELKHGPVPGGMELDHVICQNPSCCNPDHLEAVTHRVNHIRGRHRIAVVHRSGLCAKGVHRMVGKNVAPNGRGRVMCRACRMERLRSH